MGASHQNPRPRKRQELIEAVEAMVVGDPPLRWDIDREDYADVLASLARYCPGTWRHFHNNQLWVIKFE